MTARDMLEQLGVTVVDVDHLRKPAVYVSSVGVLMLRTGVDDHVIAKAVDRVLGVTTR